MSKRGVRGKPKDVQVRSDEGSLGGDKQGKVTKPNVVKEEERKNPGALGARGGEKVVGKKR